MVILIEHKNTVSAAACGCTCAMVKSFSALKKKEVCLDENSRYIVCKEIAVEDFQNGSLALFCDRFKLISLNPTARDILNHLGYEKSVHQVAIELSEKYKYPYETIFKDILELLKDLEDKGVIKQYTGPKEPR